MGAMSRQEGSRLAGYSSHPTKGECRDCEPALELAAAILVKREKCIDGYTDLEG
jgi:hypothetical protein